MEEKYEKEIDVYALVPEQFSNESHDVVDPVDMDPDVDSLFFLLEEKRKTVIPTVNITPLVVSTQTAKAAMSIKLNLKDVVDILENAVRINIEEGKNPDFSIKGILYKDRHAGNIRKPKPNKKGQFPNNFSVLIRSPMGTNKNINIKCFLKGNMTMTGCKIKEDGIAAIRILEEFLRKQKSLFETKEDAKNFRINNFSTTMVNSGYRLGFKVDRERLYDFLTQNTELNVSYNPTRYAGVKISYYYNSLNKENNGICLCPGSVCTGGGSTSGKGSGDKIGQCKRVMVAVFESGEVIDTGGSNLSQAIAAYEYINPIISKNAQKFVKINIEDILCDLNDVEYVDSD
jgi:TATA-box binding protein (TBP) (component of TFIID and TFIIIB)